MPAEERLNATKLSGRLDRHPRVKLAGYPTPLEHLPRLSAKLSRQIYIKRDDYIGPGMGGNKTRKLEYLIAEALAQNHKKLATFGGLQSNHARLTAAAARRHGLETHLFFFEAPPKLVRGNQHLNRLLGAHMHFIPIGGDGGMTLETTIRLVRWLARLWLGRHYFIPVGGHTWRGALGYVRAAIEIEKQALEMGIQGARLVIPCGSGGTLAGLIAGLSLLDSPIKPIGIDVGKLWRGFPASIAHLASEICANLGASRSFTMTDVDIIEETYVGKKYGIPSSSGQAAMQLAARLEGLLLDPVYTAKAFAGMLDLIRSGKIGKEEPVIFLHTGGAPAAFAF